MKRFICMLLCVFALLLVSACAEGETVEYRATYLDYRWVCETFESRMTDDAQAAFADRLLPGDEIVRGAQVTAYGKDGTQVAGKSMLMAVWRAGKMLLFAADTSDGVWTSSIETDDFLPADEDFRFAFSPAAEGSGPHPVDTAVFLSIARGDEEWRVTVNDGKVNLNTYARTLEDGAQFVLDMYVPSDEHNIGSSVFQGEEYADEQGYVCVFPARLAAWTMDGFPGTAEELRMWEAAHQPEVLHGEGYISGVNLRESPTGQSASKGEYTAKVKVLENVPGEKYPWHHVQVGNIDGWVSARYLHTDSVVRLCELESEVVPVARADSDLIMRKNPDGEAAEMLPKGTLLHVIHEKDGMLHVIVPRGEISWKTDWAGSYGFVSANSVTIGTSVVDTIMK